MAAAFQLHVQALGLAGQIGQVQRQGGLVATGEEARRGQFRHQGRGHHGLRLGHAVALVGPGLGHQPQLTVEVGDVQADFALPLVVQGHRRGLQGDYGDAGLRALAATGQGGVTAEGQGGEAALAGFDQLAVDVELVGAIGLAAEQRGEGVGGGVTGDIEDAHIHRRHQYAHLLGNATVGILRLHLDLERLPRAHLLRSGKAQRQLARGALQRQVQQAHGTLGRDAGLAFAGTDHQGADVEVVARPVLGQGNLEALAFGRDLDGLPPERALGGLHQQVAAAGAGRGDGDFRGIACGVGWLVQRQLDLVRAYRAAFGVVLPAVAGPEAQAAGDAGRRVLHFDSIGAPLHREADLGGAAGGHLHLLFREVQILLVVVVGPAVALGEVPVVVAALAHQAHLEVVGGQLVAGGVGHQQLELGQAVGVGFLAVEQGAQARQAFGRPDRLHQAAGDGTAAGFLQAGLEDQLQRRPGIAPAGLDVQPGLAIGVQLGLVQFDVLLQLLLGHRAELVAGQRLHRFAQRAHVELAGQAVAGGRRAVEVTAADLEARVVAWGIGLIAALELQGHAFGQEIFHEEFVKLRLAVAQVEEQLPAAGGRLGGERQLVLVETALPGFPDEAAADLFVWAAHFHGHRLAGHRAAVGVAQQGVEQHGLAGTVEVTRAEDEELQGMAGRTGDVELGQIQGRRGQAQQAGLPALASEQHLGLGRQRQFGVALAVGLAFGQHAAFAIQQFQGDIGLRGAAFQGLGEDVQAIAVAVGGKTDVAQGEEGRRVGIGVAAGLFHHGEVDARLFHRFEVGDGQQQGLAGIARGLEVEAAGVDQVGHFQQLAGLPQVQGAALAPAGEETRQRLGLDPEEVDIDLVDVQRDHRQAFGQPGGQQRAAAGEADRGLQVAGFQAGDVLLGQPSVTHRAQAGVDGQHQLALGLQVAQAQLHQVVGELPGAVHLAVAAVHQVQPLGERLIRVQGDGEGHRQGAGAVELHFGYVDHLHLATGVALGQGGGVDSRAGGLLGDAGGRLARRLIGGGRITGAEQAQHQGQK
ncbi:hypothetical protein D9M68_347970 [compost metagenome]